MKPSLSGLLASIACLAAVLPAGLAWASDGIESGYGDDLGWASIAAGAAANVPFLLYNRVKKLSVSALGGGHGITRDLSVQHSSITTFHMSLNMIGFVAGIVHGILLMDKINSFSLAFALLMTAMTVTGILLRFSKSISAKMASRMIHGQITLACLLVVTAWLHVLAETQA